jgi:hypothetical protein
MDSGPIKKSTVFQRVMEYMGIEVRSHMPKGKDGRRTTARAKGKVERPFRTVKELHETLYHFHKPADEKEANAWLLNFILRYNEKKHRFENRVPPVKGHVEKKFWTFEPGSSTFIIGGGRHDDRDQVEVLW